MPQVAYAERGGVSAVELQYGLHRKGAMTREHLSDAWPYGDGICESVAHVGRGAERKGQ